MAREHASTNTEEREPGEPDVVKQRSTPVWFFMWLSATILVGFFWGAVLAAEMVFTIPVLLWARRLLRGVRRGFITRRIRWWAGSGYSLRVTNPTVVERARSPFTFWGYIIRESMFFVIISIFLLIPLIGTVIEGGP